MSSPQISAPEQLLLELINRARLDPATEAERSGFSLNGGLPAGTIAAGPLAPLAWNADLGTAAAGHSAWMLASGTLSHFGEGGAPPPIRFAAAGYGSLYGWAENIGIVWAGDATETVLALHRSLVQSAPHRANIFGDFREIGLGIEAGSFDGRSAALLTEDFATSDAGPWLTGVAFSDADRDRFYDIGEGQGGFAVDIRGDGAGAAATSSSGGYRGALPSGTAGFVEVQARTGRATMDVSLALTGENLKLDLIDGRLLAASTDMALGLGAVDALLLGAGSLALTGNASGNRLDGNAGANRIIGQGGDDAMRGGGGSDDLRGNGGADGLWGGIGADRLEGGPGDDLLVGGPGQDRFVFEDVPGFTTGRDRIADLGSGDLIRIDLLGNLPPEGAWENSHVAAIDGGWRIALEDGSRVNVSGVTLAALEDALVLV